MTHNHRLAKWADMPGEAPQPTRADMLIPLADHYPTRLDLELLQIFVQGKTLTAERGDFWVKQYRPLDRRFPTEAGFRTFFEDMEAIREDRPDPAG